MPHGLRYLVASTRQSLRTQGIAGTWRLARDHVGARFFSARSDETARRFRLGQRLSAQLGATVAYGPFAGLKLDDNSWWGGADRGGMLLGIYEQEVLTWLASALTERQVLVDLGAADGYYAVGAVRAGLADRAIAFEATEDGRAAIYCECACERCGRPGRGVGNRIE